MAKIRLISRLDIKGNQLIKTIQLEGLRVVGDPKEFATKYSNEGIDELIYMDIVASLYQRNNLKEIVKYTSENIFVPLTVGGGIRSVEDAYSLLRSGADKIAVNTAVIKDPELIKQLSHNFGSQCVVVSIEAKIKSVDTWEAYTDNGREETGVDVLEWAKKAEDFGAGEILLTSIDNEGTRKGFDLELVKTVSNAVSIPVIACGGMNDTDSLIKVIEKADADAVAMSDCLHFNRLSIEQIRREALLSGIDVRKV